MKIKQNMKLNMIYKLCLLYILSVSSLLRTNPKSHLALPLHNGNLEDIFDNNKCMQWSLEDDQLLYNEHDSGRSIEDLCQLLKRGPNGIKARLRNINNVNHKAYQRLFIKGDTSMHIHDEPNIVIHNSTPSLRPVSDAIQRVLWDPQLNINDFSFVYKDRFGGFLKKTFQQLQ